MNKIIEKKTVQIQSLHMLAKITESQLEITDAMFYQNNGG